MPTKTAPVPKQPSPAGKPATTSTAAKSGNLKSASPNGPAAANGNGHAGHGANGHAGLDKKKLLLALEAFRSGDFNAKLDEEYPGIDGRIASVFNEVLGLNRRLVRELDKVNRVVGKEGRIAQRITLGPVEGAWSDAQDSINGLIDDLVWPTTEMSRVIGAVSNGDLSQSVALEADGRPLTGRIPAFGQNREYHGEPAVLLRFGSHARGARSGIGRQAGRPSRSEGRGRHLEGFDR